MCQLLKYNNKKKLKFKDNKFSEFSLLHYSYIEAEFVLELHLNSSWKTYSQKCHILRHSQYNMIYH